MIYYIYPGRYGLEDNSIDEVWTKTSLGYKILAPISNYYSSE